MSDLPREQICPYCSDTVEDYYAVWDYDAEEEVKCDHCHKTYVVKPQYKFEGFLIEQQCDCGEWTEDGMKLCDCGEEQTNE